MIKSLLDADEEPPPGTKVILEDEIVHLPANEAAAEPSAPPPAEIAPPEPAFLAETEKPREVFEIPENAVFFKQTSEPEPETAQFEPVFKAETTETEASPSESQTPPVEKAEEIREPYSPPPPPQTQEETAPPSVNGLFGEDVAAETKEPVREEIAAAAEPALFQSEYKQETTAETIRKSGLAYSAAIVLFGSILFMLILGWFADLLLGSSPWGIVGGIILGAIIGFIQFFRITSGIFKQ